MAHHAGARPRPRRPRPRRGGCADFGARSRNMSDWKTVRRLLCVRLDSIGDVLMTTPAIRALRETLGCSVTLLTSAAGAATAPFVPEIDEVIEFAAPWMKASHDAASEDLALMQRLRAGGFDAAAIFTVYSQSPLPAAYLCYLAAIPLRLAHCHENPYRLLTDWVLDPEPHQLVRHEVRRQLDLAAAVGCATGNVRLSFRVPRRARSKVRQLLKGCARPLVVVHPGASAASRRYPPESYARAIDLLIDDTGCEAIFTGDASEEPLVATVRGAMQRPSRSLVGRLSLGEL